MVKISSITLDIIAKYGDNLFVMSKQLTFIDTFAGIGGFHTGFSKAGYKCVFACEIDQTLRDLYSENYGLSVAGDITQIKSINIPSHDVLCAGFPCQPFSIAGKRIGSKCPTSGGLIKHIIRIVKSHRPNAIVLENVPTLLTIEKGTFWEYIKQSFLRLGYVIDYAVLSPNDFGIPQNRKRLFVLAFNNKKNHEKFTWPTYKNRFSVDIKSFLDIQPNYHRHLEPEKTAIIENWQMLIDLCKIKSLPTRCIMATEFGATYPLNMNNYTFKDIQRYKGAYGVSLSQCKSWAEIRNKLPNHVKGKEYVPKWLISSVKYSRNLYQTYKTKIEPWKAKFSKKYNSWQILDWQAGTDSTNIKDHIIQFRPSGIRIIKKHKVPAFVAMTPTQIPILGKDLRYLSKFEAARLQGFDKILLPENNTKAFKVLGNAVNAKLVELIAIQIQNCFSK